MKVNWPATFLEHSIQVICSCFENMPVCTVQAGHRKVWSGVMNPWKYVCWFMRDFSVIFWMWIGRIEWNRAETHLLAWARTIISLLSYGYPGQSLRWPARRPQQQHWFWREDCWILWPDTLHNDAVLTYTGRLTSTGITFLSFWP